MVRRRRRARRRPRCARAPAPLPPLPSAGAGAAADAGGAAYAEVEARSSTESSRARAASACMGAGRGGGGVSRTAAAPVAQAVGHRRAALGRRRRPCGRLLEPAPQVGQLQGVSVAAARRRRRRARSDLGSLSAGVGAGTVVEKEAAHRLHRLWGKAHALGGASQRPQRACRAAGSICRRRRARLIDRSNKCYLFGSKLLRIEKEVIFGRLGEREENCTTL